MVYNPNSTEILIRNAKVFNNGEAAVCEDVAIGNGRILARGLGLEAGDKTEIINADGLWLMPGLFDIHTHYDLELEVAPGLPESVRHGTTTAVIANCSLGLAFGAQRVNEADPIVDCYARVENLPKSVLRSCADAVDWSTPAGYIQHLENLPLAANVVTLVPHSMLRIEVMGFQASIQDDPTEQEIEKMKDILSEAMDIGYVGLSTDALPFHYLSNKPNTDKTIPTQFARFSEIKKLTQVVREKEGVWQATPPKDSPFEVIRSFLLTSGRVYGKPLKVTAVAALDIANNTGLADKVIKLSKFLNSKLIKGDFHMQSLGGHFKLWADGPITPLFEEIPETRRLIEVETEDRETRQKILKDPGYRTAFKKMWLSGKSGFSLARLKRVLKAEPFGFNRTLADMLIERCPLKQWEGITFEEAMERVLLVNSGVEPVLWDKSEIELIRRQFNAVKDEADFVLECLYVFDTDLTWSTVSANRCQRRVRELLMNPELLPGFNDSGAHLMNLAFYDGNLRSLKLAAQGSEQDVSFMVKRLTKDAADVFCVEGGTIYVGDVADVILIDPNALKEFDLEDSVKRIHREEYNHEQLVNRSDGVVPLVVIGGRTVWRDQQFSKDFGKEKIGRVLKLATAS